MANTTVGVPSGPSAEDERREARWQLFAAISEAVEARSFPEDEGDHPVRQALNRYVEVLASRPAGEQTSEARIKVVLHEALGTFDQWTPRQREERAGYDGFYHRPPDWLLRYFAEAVAKSLAAAPAPDGRAASETEMVPEDYPWCAHITGAGLRLIHTDGRRLDLYQAQRLLNEFEAASRGATP